MRVVFDEESCPRPPGGTAVTIGAFDGVHRGHQAVIASAAELARARHLETAVVTFDRHPASVVRPDSAPKLLTDLDQKLELLDATGLDHAVVVHFDEASSTEPADRFVERVLVGCLQAKLVVVGADFHFGSRRQGTVARLRALGAVHGFEVLGLDLVGLSGQPATAGENVSSTAVRRALAAGDVERAGALLGRAHEVRGRVGRGDGRGGEFGFRTANLDVPEEIQLPADGIYAGWYVRPSGAVHPSAISLGRRPTVHEAQPYSLLEAHLLDFDGDLYGELGRARFVRRLRDEVKFASVDALVEQIGRDCDDARAALRMGGPGTPPGSLP
ncbi:MAG: bifunctional riboflavin kinase/FAD synthetase [Acidimicrobiia bacterium]